MTDLSDIRETCEQFLADWDRHVWMQDHGEWASSVWNDARTTYTEALAALAKAAKEAPVAERVTSPRRALEDIKSALATLQEAAEALDGQVRPDESDYIATGTIDPDGVEGEAEALDVKREWSGWDCQEGWRAYRHKADLYLNWWRVAYGCLRHGRDLWVKVQADYFEE